MRADCINSFDGAEVWTSKRTRDGVVTFGLTVAQEAQGHETHTDLHLSHVRQLRDRCNAFLAEGVMAETAHEYRVCWQREGMVKRTAIYQTERGAQDKVKALLWSDEMRNETPIDAADDYFQRQFASMPRLLDTPRIESRVVGQWADHNQRGERDGE